jgi:hypothetical protein
MGLLDPNQPLPDDYKPMSFEVTTGQRIAGGLLLANAALVLASAALDPDSLKIAGVSRGPLSVVLDLVIGITLLNRSRSLLWLALVRVVIGLVVFVGLMVAKGEHLAAVVQSFLSCALLLLLIGHAGRARIVVASVMFAVYALVAAVGLYGLSTGHNLIEQARYELGGEIEAAPTELAGVTSDYRLRVPSNRWSLRTAAAARRDNPLADRWLVRPDLDAHVVVVDEQEPGAYIPPDAYADGITDNLRKAASTFTLTSRAPLRQYPVEGRLLVARSRVDGLDLDYRVATIGGYGRAYQVVAFAPSRTIAAAEADILAILESFTLPAAPAALPADIEPGPAGLVTGASSAYTLTAANDRWYTRKPEAARADNPVVDRWLVRPDMDAHILVIPEEPDPSGFEIEAYLQAVRTAVDEGNKDAVHDDMAALKLTAPNSRTFHLRAVTDGITMDYDYAVFVAGTRAYQVIAFARTDVYPALKDELAATLASFAPPR